MHSPVTWQALSDPQSTTTQSWLVIGTISFHISNGKLFLPACLVITGGFAEDLLLQDTLTDLYERLLYSKYASALLHSTSVHSVWLWNASLVSFVDWPREKRGMKLSSTSVPIIGSKRLWPPVHSMNQTSTHNTNWVSIRHALLSWSNKVKVKARILAAHHLINLV